MKTDLPLRQRSTLARLAWQLPVACVVLVVVTLLPVYQLARSMIEQQVWKTIDEDVLALAFVHRTFGLAGLVQVVRSRMASANDSALYLIADHVGTPIAGNLAVWPTQVPMRNHWRFELDMGGQHVEGKTFRLESGRWLLIAQPSPLRQLERVVVVGLSMAALLVLLATSALSWFTLRHFRRRLALISTTTARILDGQLTERVPLQTDIDIHRISVEINAALDAMHRASESVRHVTTAIAHDMRRPIATIRYRLAELAEDPSTPSSSKAKLNAALEMTDTTLSTFSALLRLARIEGGAYAMHKEPVNLQALVVEAVETYQPVVAADGRELNVRTAAAIVLGDRGLLFQVLQNLLENAIDHGAGDVDVELLSAEAMSENEMSAGEMSAGAMSADGLSSDAAGSCVMHEVRIRDYGAGVPQDALPRLTQRFFQVDAARSGNSSGIGLATVQAIVRALDGELQLRNVDPGFEARVRLPALLQTARDHQRLHGKPSQDVQ